jgi:hypothetical protein
MADNEAGHGQGRALLRLCGRGNRLRYLVGQVHMELSAVRLTADRAWIIPVAWLLAVETAAAACMALIAGHYRRPPFFESLPIAALCVVIASLWVLRGKTTMARIMGNLPRLKVILLGGLMLTAQFSLLSWCKGLMPHWSGGFWADPILANWDRAIFGVDPWLIARNVDFPLTIEFLYWLWIPLNAVVSYALLAAAPSAQKARCLVSLFAIVAFGSFFQFVLPSSGPMFYEAAGWGDRFSQIAIGAAPMTSAAQEWLWLYHVTGTVRPGGGISAMPSMHVAQAVWLVLVASVYCRKLVPIALAYLAAIVIGSVHLGFHYAVDAPVSMAAMMVIWWALGSWRDRFVRVACVEA